MLDPHVFAAGLRDAPVYLRPSHEMLTDDMMYMKPSTMMVFRVCHYLGHVLSLNTVAPTAWPPRSFKAMEQSQLLLQTSHFQRQA